MEKGSKKILHVDDEPDIVYVVEFILTSGGFEVVRINDSTEAVANLLKDSFDLLILDLMMPKMSGFDVMTAIRKEPKLKKQPVLILSSRQLSNEETRFLEDMNAKVMAKPFEPHRLLEKVREMVTE